VPGTRFTYARGKLVLWSADSAKVDAQGRLLIRAPEGKLAIADPRLAPYGAAAMETLARLNVLAAWKPNIVQGENIGQAFQFASTGAAPYGFVALAQVMEGGKITKGSAWIVPGNLYSPLKQDAVLLRKGEANEAARALMSFLKSDAVHETLRGYGYEF